MSNIPYSTTPQCTPSFSSLSSYSNNWTSSYLTRTSLSLCFTSVSSFFYSHHSIASSSSAACSALLWANWHHITFCLALLALMRHGGCTWLPSCRCIIWTRVGLVMWCRISPWMYLTCAMLSWYWSSWRSAIKFTGTWFLIRSGTMCCSLSGYAVWWRYVNWSGSAVSYLITQLPTNKYCVFCQHLCCLVGLSSKCV